MYRGVHCSPSLSAKKGPDKTNKAAIQALDIRRIRNIGVMAHIDAGKTTTTGGEHDVDNGAECAGKS